jgi:streptogramin lyase
MADGTLSRIDPSTLAVRTNRVGGSPSWTAWGDGRLWVSDASGIDDISLGSGRASRHVGLGGKPNDGDIIGGDVWVTDTSGTLHEIDAASGRRLGAWPLGLNDPFVLAGYAGKLWTVDFMGTNLAEIDPARLSSMSS